MNTTIKNLFFQWHLFLNKTPQNLRDCALIGIYNLVVITFVIITALKLTGTFDSVRFISYTLPIIIVSLSPFVRYYWNKK